MKQLLLLCAGFPLWAASQEVKPVLSADYQARIHKDTSHRLRLTLTDTTHSMRHAPLRYTQYNFNNQFKVGKIRVNRANELIFRPVYPKSVTYAGNASISIGLQIPGQQPATQQEYVQGRSISGGLQWQGPETGELLSYGPSIHTLEYDGSIYDWDQNGRLIPGGGGNDGGGKKASPYSNSILRNGASIITAVSLFTRYRKNGNSLFSTTLRAADGREQTIVRGNNNRTGNFSFITDWQRHSTSISITFSIREERSTHSNRNGFLNRVYQNSMTTPVSFSNSQGTLLRNGQRSYSSEADNPLFLLGDDTHAFRQQQQNIYLTAEQKINKFKLRLAQSLDLRRQLSREGYRPGTAFFPTGLNQQRSTLDQNYWLSTTLTREIRIPGNYKFSAQGQFSYIYTSNRSSIHYSFAHKDYRYHRRLHEPGIFLSADYKNGKTESGIRMSARSYFSGTAARSAAVLPNVSGYTWLRNLFNRHHLEIKLMGAFSRFNSELPLSTSVAGNSLLQYSSANAGLYQPVDEINSFDRVLPERHSEITLGTQIVFLKGTNLFFNYFVRNTRDDLLPVPAASGGFNLVNMASYRNRGFELEFTHGPWIFKSQKFGLANTLSLTRNRNLVTSVKEGYNHSPIAGFSNVHKTLVQGQPLGVISGNSWLRHQNGQLLIGQDGFPLVNPALSVIGDPNPDFIVKLNQYFSFKRVLELRIDWQWQKGGDAWHGTNALLDYTGRSAASGAQRGISGYVFNGVHADGSKNTTPVQFYNPLLPVEQNRWVRYGPAGVAEDYIVPADHIRIQQISISFKPAMRKKIKELVFTLYAGNIPVWTATKGIDAGQLLYDIPGSGGLQYFNLPAVRTFGFSSSIQF